MIVKLCHFLPPLRLQERTRKPSFQHACNNMQRPTTRDSSEHRPHALYPCPSSKCVFDPAVQYLASEFSRYGLEPLLLHCLLIPGTQTRGCRLATAAPHKSASLDGQCFAFIGGFTPAQQRCRENGMSHTLESFLQQIQSHTLVCGVFLLVLCAPVPSGERIVLEAVAVLFQQQECRGSEMQLYPAT